MKKEVAILCVLKSGGDYKPDDVFRLKKMLEKNITIPYTFYCLTDMFRWIDDLPGIPLKYDYPGWWSKIELFRPNLVKEKRIVYFDLDTVILDNIDDILLQNHHFIGLRPFNPTRSTWSGYVASAIMSWSNDGSLHFIEERYDPDRDFHGDQDYISAVLEETGTTFKYWQDLVKGIYSYKRHVQVHGLQKDARVVCFHGKPRPRDVKKSWIKEAIA